MNRVQKWLVCCVGLCLFVSQDLAAEEHAATLPMAPEGFRWELNEPYSDEFNGTELDRNKWHDHYPGWVGRVPGKFVPSSISVKDGFLQIKSTVLDPPDGDFNIACGAVQTKAAEASFGYYECRMKASEVSTSSTFWLKNHADQTKDAYVLTELDIQESIGNAQRWPSFGNHLMSNTHVFKYERVPQASEEAGDDEKKAEAKPVFKQTGHAKSGNRFGLPTGVSEDFYTFGCWWVDANTMKFYVNGEYVYSIEAPQDLGPDPFDQPMFVNLVCEIYTWEKTPLLENLKDDSKNTTYYDYVRAYKLVPTE